MRIEKQKNQFFFMINDNLGFNLRKIKQTRNQQINVKFILLEWDCRSGE